jgi:adenine-specific DNA-methyltransferase
MSEYANTSQTAERRIGAREHNKFVAEGVDEHRPTSRAPQGLFERLSEASTEAVRARHERFLREVTPVLGEPLFEKPGFVLFNRDSVDSLEKIAATAARFELTVTSPPYNIGKEYEANMPVPRYVEWCARWMTSIHAASTPSASFWLNVGYFEVPSRGLCVPISYLLWDKSPFYMLQEIVWTYGAGVTSKRRLAPRNEKWLFYVRDPENYTFNLDDIRDPNVKYPNQKKNGKFRCNPTGKNPSDVWEFPKVTTGTDRSSKERTGHPAQFPLGVVERIVRASSNVGQIVLDPFAGSCSTGIAAYGTGRVFVGFELRRDYCEMAVERFLAFERERAERQSQPDLF